MNAIRFFVLTICVLLTCSHAFSGIEQYSNRIEGNAIYVGNSFDLYDVRYFDMSTSTSWSSDFTNYKVSNKVQLGIRPDVVQSTTFSGSVDLQIDYDTWSAGSFNTTTEYVTLAVSYDVNGVAIIDDISSFVFEDAHKISVSILNITGLNQDDIFVQSEIQVERYYAFDNSSVTGAGWTNLGNGFLEFNWDVKSGAEYYELEWVHVNDYTLDQGVYLAQSALNYDFYLNSTRIVTKNNWYKIPEVFDHGYLIFRVRPIGLKGSDFTIRKDGAWNASEKGLISSFPVSQKIATTEYDPNMNWTHSVGYAEEGKRFEAVSYIDGLGRGRQSVSHNTVTQQAVISNVYYDNLGRPAVSDLPTPSDQEWMRHRPDFNISNISPFYPYSANSFDNSASSNCNPIAAGFLETSGAGQYYSVNNPNQDGANSYIPDAERYPFNRITYTPDFSGRVRQVSGYGDDLSIGTGRTTQYYYPSIGQKELNELFGTEVGYYGHYQKMVTVDPNGQVYAQITDMAGRVIASYMMGDAPENVSVLPNNLTTMGNVDTTEIMMNGSNQTIETNPPSAQVTYTEYIVDDDTYTFNYAFSPAQYQGTCLASNICFDCVYDLTLIVKDECGVEAWNNSETINGIQLDEICNNPTSFSLTQSLPLTRGQYTIEKILTVNQLAINDYWCFYIENEVCMDPLSVRFNELYLNEPFVECDPEPLINSSSSCDVAEEYMLEDVSPGGQYAEFDFNGGNYSATDPTSIFFNDAYTNYYYTIDGTPSGTAITAIDPVSGIPVSPSVLSIDQFIALFDDSWAPSLVVQHHPESCYLDFCALSSSSSAFDALLIGENTFAGANAAGYFDPIGTLLAGTHNVNGIPAITTVSGINPTTVGNVDPFFTTSPGSAYLSQMNGIMDSYITIDDNGTPVELTMWQYAIYVSVKDVCFSNTILECINTQTSFDCNEGHFNDLIWINFREAYLEAKTYFVFQAQQQYAASNDCLNECIGSSALGCEDYADKTPRFPNPALSIGTTGQSINNIISSSNPYSTATAVQTQLIADACNQMAEDVSDDWITSLSGCDFVTAGVNLTTLKNDMIALLVAGCDQNNMSVASTTPSGVTLYSLNGGSPYTSLDELLEIYLGSGYENNLCSELLISYPGPYKDLATTMSAIEKPLDICGCDAVFEAYEVSLAMSISIEEALMQTTGVSLADADYLLCTCGHYCNGYNQWSDPNFAWPANTQTLMGLSGITIPVDLSCGGECDVDCATIAADIQNLETRFSGVSNFSTASNYQVILTNYLNQTYNYTLTYSHYQTFLAKCAATVNEPYCEVNPVLPKLAEVATLIAYRGQLLNNNLNQVDLASENIVYSSTEILQGVFSSNNYWGEVTGNTLAMHFGNCEITITESNFDFSSIIGFGVVLPTSSTCGLDSDFQLEVFYLDCGVRTSAFLNASTTCFDVMECVCDPSGILLCNEPISFSEQPCYEPRLSELYQITLDDYGDAVNAVRDDFKLEYNAACAAAFNTENLYYDGLVRRYQYTLFYYDQAGNLVKTVAPGGVDQLPSAQNPTINAARDAVTSSSSTGAILPAHDYLTEYAYNSYNQLVNTTNPDQEGKTRFWYDRYGRIAASQNPVQEQDNFYSYTFYDAQGRPVEVGQTSPASPPSEAILKADDLGASFQTWANAGFQTEITRTKYDRSFSPAIAALFANGQQENLRLRVASVFYYKIEGANYESAVHYSYDIHGNVKEQVQDVPPMASAGQNIKSTQYEYELISGNVTEVSYQKDKIDQLTHNYHYDELNRLTEVFTTTDKVHETKEAHYRYYDYGPLARTEIGEYQVQGQDFNYTINGWLKGLNSSKLDVTHDMGHDAYVGYLAGQPNAHALFAKDVNAYTIGYFDGDYSAINTNTTMEMTSQPLDPFRQEGFDLFNGNIKHLVTSIYGMETMGANYRYDQLQRLKIMTPFINTNTDNTWTGVLSTDDYFNEYGYDLNGNILTLFRNGTVATGLNMDNLTYNYVGLDGNPNASSTQRSNRLNYVSDSGTDDATATSDDIKNADMSVGNFDYDEIGQLTRDLSEDIIALEWRFGDKKLHRIVGTNDHPDVEFIYNPLGIRVMKLVKPRTANVLSGSDKWITTYYSYDANGQCMAVYEGKYLDISDETYEVKLKEQHIYGSSRLGMIQPELVVVSNWPIPYEPEEVVQNELGKRRYELTNHLGNVQAVITDRKTPNDQTILENTTFATNASGWQPCGQATLTYVSTSQSINISGNAQPNNCVYKTVSSFVPGETYTATITANYGTAPGLELSLFGIGNYPLLDGITTDITFTANSSSIALIIQPTDYAATYNYSILDVKVATPLQYEAVVVMTSDYYPFGMAMPGRQNVNISNSEDYRFAYNGMETDNEVSGNGNSYTTEFRQYDPRLGRWKSLDPLMAKYPSMSPYVAFNNNPVFYIDPLGLEGTGDYFDTKTGKYLGTDGVKDGKEYLIDKNTYDYISNSKGFSELSNNQKKATLGVAVEYGSEVSDYSYSSKAGREPTLSLEDESKVVKSQEIIAQRKTNSIPQKKENNETKKSNESTGGDLDNDDINLLPIVPPTMVLLGQPIKALKPFGALGSAPGSSVASWGLRKALPMKIPYGGRIMGTRIVGGALGRTIPVIGWIWTAGEIFYVLGSDDTENFILVRATEYHQNDAEIKRNEGFGSGSINNQPAVWNPVGSSTANDTETEPKKIPVTLGSPVWNPVSDSTLKTNLVLFNVDVIDKLSALKVYTYYYSEESQELFNLPSDLQFGFLAQEVEKIFPDLVDVNNDGNMYISFHELIPLLSLSIGKQQEKIKHLEKEIQEIRQIIGDMESKMR